MEPVNGWQLYPHPEFSAQLAKLKARVEKTKASNPGGYEKRHEAKLLKAIIALTTQIIPADPGARQFRHGGTLGDKRKHWFRAKFGNGRYRLFFQFNSVAKIIIYAWVKDAASLRTYGAKSDAYAVFRSMLDQGNPPDGWVELMEAAGRGAEGGKARR